MQLVVLRAVIAAVNTDTASWSIVFQVCLFFIIVKILIVNTLFVYVLFLSANRELFTNPRPPSIRGYLPLPNLPHRGGLTGYASIKVSPAKLSVQLQLRRDSA